MKAFDVLQKLIGTAIARFHRMGAHRFRDSDVDRGTPGEMLKYLSPTEREALQTLSADDIAIEKLPHDQVYFLVDNENFYSPRYYDAMNSEEKIKFDKKILK
jgi:hypothetical protein